MVRGLRCPVTYLLLQFADIHRYIPPCWHSVSLREKTLQAPALRPCAELSSAPWVGRHPHRLLRPDAPLHSRGFAPYSALGPQPQWLGASHFGLCSRSGIWGFISRFPPRLPSLPLSSRGEVPVSDTVDSATWVRRGLPVVLCRARRFPAWRRGTVQVYPVLPSNPI